MVSILHDLTTDIRYWTIFLFQPEAICLLTEWFTWIKTRDVHIKKSTWLAQFNRKSKSCKYRRLSVFVPLLSPRYLFCLSFYFSQFVVHVLIGIIAMIFEIFKAVLSRPVRKKNVSVGFGNQSFFALKSVIYACYKKFPRFSLNSLYLFHSV